MNSYAAFLLHLLPKRFVRIRNFGFLANRPPHRFVAALLSVTPSRLGPQTGQDSANPLMVRKIFGAVPSAVAQWWSLNDSLPPKSGYVLPPLPITAAV